MKQAAAVGVVEHRNSAVLMTIGPGGEFLGRGKGKDLESFLAITAALATQL
jgi:hypothetical protein